MRYKTTSQITSLLYMWQIVSVEQISSDPMIPSEYKVGNGWSFEDLLEEMIFERVPLSSQCILRKPH